MSPRRGPTLVGPHLWEIRAIRETFWIALALAAALVVFSLPTVFMPVFLALLLAYVVNPIVDAAERRLRWPRPLTISLLLVGAALVFFGPVLGFLPLLREQVTALAERLPRYAETLSRTDNQFVRELAAGAERGIRRVLAEPWTFVSQVFQRSDQAASFLATVFNTTTYVLLSLAIVPVYFFVFSWTFPAMIAWFVPFIPESRRKRTLEIVAKMDRAVAAFFRGRIVIAGIMGAMFAIGWMFAGVPYWFVLGMLTGFLSLVPFAAALGWPLAVVLKYADVATEGGGMDWMAVLVWPSVVYGAVQFVEGWILTPWLQGRDMDMSSATIVLVVFLGGAVAGAWGMLLAIPITACVKIFLQEVALPRLRSSAAAS